MNRFKPNLGSSGPDQGLQKISIHPRTKNHIKADLFMATDFLYYKPVIRGLPRRLVFPWLPGTRFPLGKSPRESD